MHGIYTSETMGLDSVDYDVVIYLAFSDQDGQFLKPDTSRLSFSEGREIGSGSLPYIDPLPASPPRVRLLAYNWKAQQPGNFLSAYSIFENYPNQTNILVGFVGQFAAGRQYGWVRMERQVSDVSQMIAPDGSISRYAFQPTAFALHPIPDRPIRAGMPPELPVLDSSRVTLDGGVPGIRIAWPSGWPGMVLEYASELANPTVWQPVPDVVGTDATLPLPEDGQLFFRLRYVP